MNEKNLTTARLYEDIKRLTGNEITAGALAQAINESAQTVNNWSKRGVSNEGLIKCAVEFFGLDVFYIIKGERKVIRDGKSNVKNVSLNELLKTDDPLKKMADKLVEIFLSLNEDNQDLLQLIANKMYEFDHPSDKRANGKKGKIKESEKQ